MQMNRWLTPLEPEDEEDSYHPVRPRASVWIDPLAQQSISASYLAKEQQVIPNPQTPIPARASAPHAAHTVKVRPRYTQNIAPTRESDITQLPTLPERTGVPGSTGPIRPTRSTISTLPTRPAMWQYELADYEAGSSLPSLSLAYPEPAAAPVLDELDTLPPPQARKTGDIDQIDTLVPPKQYSPAAQKSPAGSPGQKLDTALVSNSPFSQSTGLQRQKSMTLPAPHAVGADGTISPGAATVAVPQMPIGNQKLDFLAKVQQGKGGSGSLVEDAASWTAGQGKGSLFAKRIVSRSQRKSTLSLSPLDRLRWWLLVPGRIEFLLWLGGTIVLVGVTCMLLFATLLSTGWSNTRLSSIGASGGATQASHTSGNTTTTGKSSCTAANAKSPQCDSTTVVSSNGLQLTIVNNALLLPGMPIYVHGQGFTVNNTVSFSYDAALPCRPSAISTDGRGNFSLYLMLDAGPRIGVHHIVAYDVATKHSVTVTVTISPPPMGKTVSPSPTRTIAGATPTAGSGTGGGALPTPVGQTPIPITPTVGVTPTVVPTKQPTPTIGVTPTPGKVPTVGITATVAPHVTPTVGTQGTTGAASILKNALYEEHADGHATFSIWLWLAIIGYALSMTLLGCAGLLYRRNRRMSSK